MLSTECTDDSLNNPTDILYLENYNELIKFATLTSIINLS